jgi:radical SAM superfamily enzyme YgiQ (UPF0313 family)
MAVPAERSAARTGRSGGTGSGPDLLLTHGHLLAEDAHERRIMRPYPPLGILCLSAYLKQRGFAVEVLDTTFATMADFEARLQAARPAALGISCNIMTRPTVVRMIAAAKRRALAVIVGGPEPVNHIAEFLDAGADVVVAGEGEETLAELLPRLLERGARALEGVRGISYRNTAGAIAHNPPRPLIADLAELPWPDREAIRLEDYLEAWRARHGLGSVSLITSRGCPFHCDWCSSSVYGDTLRKRPVEDVLDEIAWLRRRYAPDMLWIADDVFTIRRPWARAWCAGMVERGLRMPFECIVRPDTVDEKLLAGLRAAGCFRIWMGSESGSQRVLDAMRRGIKVERLRAMTAAARTAGLEVGYFVMLGYPGEERGDVEATIEHLARANPDHVLTTVAYPLKGTGLYAKVQDRILDHAPWASRRDSTLSFRGRYPDRFYRHANVRILAEAELRRLRRSRSWSPRRWRLIARCWRARLGMRWASRVKLAELRPLQSHLPS